MSVALKWIEPEELGAYLKKGWTEVELRFEASGKYLIASPDEPASEPAKVECDFCCGDGEGGHDPNCLVIAPCEPAQPEPVATVCPNCGHGDDWSHGIGYNKACMVRTQPEPVAAEMPFLRDELSRLLNRHSRENHSNTPDFVLAGFLMDALCAWERATGERDTFFGQNPRFAAGVNGPERAQPAKVRMTEELELALFVALHTVNHDDRWSPDYAEKVRAAIAAVRAQAAEAGKVTP